MVFKVKHGIVFIDELDKVALIDWFKEHDIPTLYLELDVTVPLGQFKIRVEALLENLREDEIW